MRDAIDAQLCNPSPSSLRPRPPSSLRSSANTIGIHKMSSSSSVVSPAGRLASIIGDQSEEYVSTVYGIGRLVLPFTPRTDGIVVILTSWSVIFLSESCVTRLDGYRHNLLKEVVTRAEASVASAKRSDGSAKDARAMMELQTQALLAKLAASELLASAPLSVPLYRRRQMFVLAFSTFFSLLCVAVSLALIRSDGVLFYAFLLYIGWMVTFQSYHKNGRGLKSDWFRRISWFTWFRDYFPIHLHATAVLDPKGRYVFGYHPHGLLSLGALINFGTEATGFAEKFPGIDLRLLTLTTNFRIPFYGFFLSMMGLADSSRDSCNKCLQIGPGASIALVLGGAKESLDAHPYRDYQLTIHRKGFVKVALENGADLVPVFSFGENDVWDQVENERGSPLRRIQERLQQKLGFAMPLIKGRGIFLYNVGILAHRRRNTIEIEMR